jgi:hypothetical protein
MAVMNVLNKMICGRITLLLSNTCTDGCIHLYNLQSERERGRHEFKQTTPSILQKISHISPTSHSVLGRQVLPELALASRGTTAHTSTPASTSSTARTRQTASVLQGTKVPGTYEVKTHRQRIKKTEYFWQNSFGKTVLYIRCQVWILF